MFPDERVPWRRGSFKFRSRCNWSVCVCVCVCVCVSHGNLGTFLLNDLSSLFHILDLLPLFCLLWFFRLCDPDPNVSVSDSLDQVLSRMWRLRAPVVQLTEGHELLVLKGTFLCLCLKDLVYYHSHQLISILISSNDVNTTEYRFTFLNDFIIMQSQLEIDKTEPTRPDAALTASVQAPGEWKLVGNYLQVVKSNCHVVIASFYYFDRRGFDKSLHFSPCVEILSYNRGKAVYFRLLFLFLMVNFMEVSRTMQLII